jgi:hypothetical protein
MKVVLEWDDFSPINHQFTYLEKLREHYPNIKFSMFAIPWEIRFGGNGGHPITEDRYTPWVDAVKQCSDWIELELHGFTHAPMEFAEISEDGAYKRITVGEKMFANRGLKLNKIFKAPFWALSKEGRAAITKMGYVIVDDGYYNWNLSDPCPFTPEQILNDEGLIIGHGHMTNDGCNNSIDDVAVLSRIMKLPPDTEFIFLSETIKEKEQTNG